MIANRHEIQHDARSQRPAFALVTTMLLITLLIAVSAQLVTVTSMGAVNNSRRRHSLSHELAVDSALLLLADELAAADGDMSGLIRDLNHSGEVLRTFIIGIVKVQCTIRDDGAKFNPRLFERPDQQRRLARKLTLLANTKRLPPARVGLRPTVTSNTSESGSLYRWFDQILTNIEPGMLFPWNKGDADSDPGLVWSNAVTFWGDGRVDLRRVDMDTLEVVLEDIQPGLGRRMLSARPADRSVDFRQSALSRIPAELRQKVAARVTYNGGRYAIQIDTMIHADRRRWYVVAQFNGGDFSVLHRSRLTW